MLLLFLMICMCIEPCLLSLSYLIIILILLVRIKGQINLYLRVIIVVLVVIFAQIVSKLGLSNLETKVLSLEKKNQVLKNMLAC
jgi:hypothetical protein